MFKNEFGFSFTRAQTLETCPRKFYYGVYRMWGGWWSRGVRPPPSAEEAYVAKFATTVPMFIGSIVHWCAEYALKEARRSNSVVDVVQLTKQLTELGVARLNEGFEQAVQRRSGNPKNRIQLVEVNNQLPYDQSAAIEKVRRLIAFLCAPDERWTNGKNPFVRALTVPERIVSVEDLVQTTMFGVRVFLKIDLLMRGLSSHRSCSIVDWKSGRRVDANVVGQRDVYVAWARTIAWNEIYFVPVWLGGESPEMTKERVDADAATTRAAVIINGYRDKLASMLVDNDVEKNEPIESEFVTTVGAHCEECQFKRMCVRDRSKRSDVDGRC